MRQEPSFTVVTWLVQGCGQYLTNNDLFQQRKSLNM